MVEMFIRQAGHCRENDFDLSRISDIDDGFDVTSKEPEHRNAYARARQMRVEKWIDEMVPMTDKVIGQEMANVTATRNAVEIRKWVASRLMPNQYGDQPSSVTINNQTSIVMVSEERQRELQAVRQRMIKQQKVG